MSKLRKLKDELLAYGYIREQTHPFSISIPSDVVQLFVMFYHFTYEILQFSAEFQSSNSFKLEDNNTCAISIRSGHSFIIVDTEPVTTGIHCWRVKTYNRGGWTMWAVSKKKEHDASSFNEAFGISKYNNQNYPKGAYTNSAGSYYNKNVNKNCNKKYFMELSDGMVDMLLNVDKGELNICVVGRCYDPYEVKMNSLPIPNVQHVITEGWVPHFNSCSSQQRLRVAKIPIDWYGTKQDDINWSSSI